MLTVLIDVSAKLTVDHGVLVGVETDWTFDEAFSGLILGDYPNQGPYSATVTAAIKKDYFDNLKNFHYFSYFAVGKKALPVPPPQEFRATVSDDQVTFHFSFPLKVKLGAEGFSAAFYDDTYYTDMGFIKKDPVSAEVVGGGSASVSLRPNQAKAYFGGGVIPDYLYLAWTPP